MELISKEELVKELTGTSLMLKDIPTWPPKYEDTNVFHIIDKIPIVEQKNGHWIDRKELIDADLNLWGYSQICSECGFILGAKEYNYCPNCGAKMEEKSNGIINNME